MKIAIITGAAGGIGRALAFRLHEDGFALVLAGRTASALEGLSDELRRAGATTLIVPTDVGKPEQVQNLVQKTLAEFGRVDVVVNNAGYAPMVSTADITTGQWQDILNVNLSSVFYMTRAVWPVMQRQHLEFVSDHRKEHGDKPPDREANTGGIIVNISSVAARDPFPGLGAYAAAKVAVNMLTKVTAAEGEPNGIRVYAVGPSGVETGMLRSLLSAEQLPTEEILRPEDVADTVAACIGGALRWSAGETLYVHRRV
jgi:gluconate 5-dehydrogenase